jgi:hypothetical protein
LRLGIAYNLYILISITLINISIRLRQTTLYNFATNELQS